MKSPNPSSDTAGSGEPLQGRHIVLCVTGGIAAYKAAYLTRALVKAGARVAVIMTEAAQRFVAPLTFETLSGNRVVTSTFDRVFEMGAVEHVDLAGWADAVVVAPATYNLLGKLHAGIADDAVTTFLSAVVCPVLVAPAMNEHMWRNAINQRNVAGLKALGYRFVDPERGGLACSWEGEGRMAEPETIVSALRTLLAKAPSSRTANAGGSAARQSSSPRNESRALADLDVLVTAAGTWEAIDPVRFVGNRASGRMGYALAAAAARRGARVHLVSGPSALVPPTGLADFAKVESAAEMLRVCQEWLPRTGILLMAAAVADYRPREVAPRKIKRTRSALQLDLEPTPDVLATLRAAKGGRLFVGFALETDADPGPAAQQKLRDKGLDLIVANRVGEETGPDQRTNQVWIWNAEGLVEATPVLEKELIAEIVLDAVEGELAKRRAPARA
ncbi:MAG TPA: bifunctional phosphopantothenoylcysteine decarboxylase/phosphopantothenate synthase [Candidatus Krumholzibacteria bacterium]|nr:bifunctional phosphopantothenoylcysteine decarboxylase/phosphopantothenate synthase [Candidatus Krumholzibacteria bacterium]